MMSTLRIGQVGRYRLGTLWLPGPLVTERDIGKVTILPVPFLDNKQQMIYTYHNLHTKSKSE